MTILDRFTAADRELLIALPYRAGLWIGDSDETGGSEASAAEMQALESIVTGFVEDFCKSEFVETLMRETLARKADWQSWRNHIDRVPDECRRAVKLLSQNVEQKHVASLKNNLIEIAFAVALAYREYGEGTPAFEKLSLHARYYWERHKARRQNRIPLTLDQSLNISSTEQKAIKALTGALRPEMVEGLPNAQAA